MRYCIASSKNTLYTAHAHDRRVAVAVERTLLRWPVGRSVIPTRSTCSNFFSATVARLVRCSWLFRAAAALVTSSLQLRALSLPRKKNTVLLRQRFMTSLNSSLLLSCCSVAVIAGSFPNGSLGCFDSVAEADLHAGQHVPWPPSFWYIFMCS